MVVGREHGVVGQDAAAADPVGGGLRYQRESKDRRANWASIATLPVPGIAENCVIRLSYQIGFIGLASFLTDRIYLVFKRKTQNGRFFFSLLAALHHFSQVLFSATPADICEQGKSNSLLVQTFGTNSPRYRSFQLGKFPIDDWQENGQVIVSCPTKIIIYPHLHHITYKLVI